ncbi:guanine deaminase [Teredinibacter waterburyi]|uniref:guanine deaminase n=1 Tax=Teredinibacter waterburyi TaxID=1500538 RepID=UPI00165EF7C8|nr:guanine deaminase [Teredinibacter waterburyi]
MTSLAAYRGAILHFLHEPNATAPGVTNPDDATSTALPAWQYWQDGLLLVENGHIRQLGDASELLPQLAAELAEGLAIQHYPHHLILPGFVDTHIHYPQTEMIGAYGEQLLRWLNTYTFPTEQKFANPAYAEQVAAFFLAELLRNGTTTAMVFGTVHPQSVDALFSAAQQHGLRLIAGKVMMDRNAPSALCDTAETSYSETRALIERWHGVDRLQYAITPRFAITSSPEQLNMAGKLLSEFDDVYLHTHLAENHDEVAWVKELFPTARHYLDVYAQAGLVGKRSVFAHGIHLSDDECSLLASRDAAIAHCPTSNLFLGSGLLNLTRLQNAGVKVGLGTDIGAGSSFSLFRTMDEAYKVQQLQGCNLAPMQALYMATLGGAKALDLESKIGNFAAGKEADFTLLDLHATPLLKFRTAHCKNIEELVFVLNTLGDDRLIEKTFALGRCVHQRD